MISPRYLLDTNICIYIQRQKPFDVLARFEKLKPGEAVISVVTWGELLYGAEKSRHSKKVLYLLDEFIAIIPVLPMTGTTGKTYGRIRSFLESNGTPIGNNEREFQRVPGLKVENWAS